MCLLRPTLARLNESRKAVFGSIETAMEATRLGARDFVQKPLSLAKLLATVKAALASGGSTASNAASATRSRKVIMGFPLKFGGQLARGRKAAQVT